MVYRFVKHMVGFFGGLQLGFLYCLDTLLDEPEVFTQVASFEPHAFNFAIVDWQFPLEEQGGNVQEHRQSALHIVFGSPDAFTVLPVNAGNHTVHCPVWHMSCVFAHFFYLMDKLLNEGIVRVLGVRAHRYD